MARGDAEAVRQRLQTLLFQRTSLDPRVGSGCQTRWRVDWRQTRCALGTAQQARAKSRRFSRCCRRPKRPVHALRRPRWADAAAIDARRKDAYIEAPVEPAVLCITCRVAGISVQDHGTN